MAVEPGATAESPPAENIAVTSETPAAAAPSTDVTAGSSPAKDESLLDRVKAAIQPKPEGSSPSPGSQEAKPNSETPSEDDDKEPDSDPTEEEQARYHSKTRKQVKRLLSQRNEALDKVKELEPDAQVGQRLTSFLSDSGISSQEANLLLDIGRNLKRDPLKALEQIKPFYEQLSRMAGEVLPSDLQEAVTKGEITEPYARQLARNRTETAVLSRRTQAQDEQAQQRTAQEQTQAHAAAVGQAISTWEANQAKADPDWSLKQDRLGELIELEIRRRGPQGYPKTTAEAIQIAEQAKAKVNAEMARFAPRKTAINPANPASAARPAPAKPTTALEAARLALAPAA